jgi:hypothetical protein
VKIILAGFREIFLKACIVTFLGITVANEDHVVGVTIIFLKTCAGLLLSFGYQQQVQVRIMCLIRVIFLKACIVYLSLDTSSK